MYFRSLICELLLANELITFEVDQLVKGVKKVVHQIGDCILNDRRKLIDYVIKRHKNRESLKTIDKVKDDQTKIWFCHGNRLVMMNSNEVKMKIANGNDNEVINDKIDKIRCEIKLNLAKLKRVEGKQQVRFEANL